MDKEQRIRDAARELAAALTANGGDYFVSLNSYDVTTMDSEGRERVFVIEVEQTSCRRIAP